MGGHLPNVVSSSGGPQVNAMPMANTQNPNASPANMAAALNAQQCQSLIAAPRLNGNQLSFPSPAAAAAAAMGLQMHHAAAAAAMSAAAAASGQQQQQQQQQNLNNNQHPNHLGQDSVVNGGGMVGIGGGATQLNSLNGSNSNMTLNLNAPTNNTNNNNNSLSTINIPPPHIRPSP
ncbi:uncharacterized protein, partial [Musca autumnalis]|uniref:uncharacterized protein n=1 Tax=Musca autumnalis TaxID=221902 RepID=UPI003CEE535F